MKKYKFTIHGNQYDVQIHNVEDNIIELEVNGSTYNVEVDKTLQPVKTPKLVRARAVPATDTTPSEGTGSKGGVSATIKAPLPGTILSIHCRIGDSITMGQKLITLEAMKMENNIDSDRVGKVLDIKVKEGQSVMEGDVMIEIGG
ncbi:MAG: acetyl-CoA carboxylase biotin carboxyl carrier protein subunit [Bacteroidetes bacterium]|nr:MAG: acetyl-CoA carboxylase biotin carboxyl carrier protein subunit [Bacteroidota bacterium]